LVSHDLLASPRNSHDDPQQKTPTKAQALDEVNQKLEVQRLVPIVTHS
jgi:hypothetical protein